MDEIRPAYRTAKFGLQRHSYVYSMEIDFSFHVQPSKNPIKNIYSTYL